MCSGSQAGSYLRLIDSCITQLEVQGPSRTCIESQEEEEVTRNESAAPVGRNLATCEQPGNRLNGFGLELNIIAQLYLTKLFLKSFCRSQLPHKSVNLSFTVTYVKNKLTDLYGNWLLPNDFKNTWWNKTVFLSLEDPCVLLLYLLLTCCNRVTWTASERRGGGNCRLSRESKARIWPWLSYMCPIRSTAVKHIRWVTPLCPPPLRLIPLHGGGFASASREMAGLPGLEFISQKVSLTRFGAPLGNAHDARSACQPQTLTPKPLTQIYS